MCGIAGVLKFNGQVSATEVKKMIDKLAHRGPDGEGVWISPDEILGLGHRRLAIIDLGESGNQPMAYANDRLLITFNGEIYNYLELKKILIQQGYQFRSSGDTEVVLAMYHWKGKDMMNFLDGMFAFAIWDSQEKKVFCARDRYGEKPFYYNISQDGFYFASEMKALFAIGISAEIDKSMVANYLFNDLVVHPTENVRTNYKNIKKLDKASFMEISPTGDCKIESYYSIAKNGYENNITEASQKFYELLNESVKMRMRSDVKVGSSVSGGIDSAIIAFLISENLKKSNSEYSFSTFSGRFKEEGFSEDEFLNCLLEDLNLKNFSVYPAENLIHEELEKVFYHQEEPFLSSSILNQWSVMRLAKQENITVLLDGQGADELLAGYGWYKKIHLLELAKTSKKNYHEEILARVSNGFSKEKLGFVDWMKINWGSGVQFAAKIRHYSTKKWGFNAISKNAVWHQILNKSFCDLESEGLPVVPPYPLHLNKVLEKDFSLILETLLRYADRSSMAFSREVRMPYLSHELVDFCFSLDSSFKISGGWKKFILRKAFENKIPDKITWRRDKMGYAAPEQKWLKAEKNQEYVMDCWQDLQNRGVIKSDLPFHSDVAWKILMLHAMMGFSTMDFSK